MEKAPCPEMSQNVPAPKTHRDANDVPVSTYASPDPEHGTFSQPPYHATMLHIPPYLDVPGNKLGEGTPVGVRVVSGGMEDVAREMADVMLEEIRRCQRDGRSATFIVPVGPVDQF